MYMWFHTCMRKSFFFIVIVEDGYGTEEDEKEELWCSDHELCSAMRQNSISRSHVHSLLLLLLLLCLSSTPREFAWIFFRLPLPLWLFASLLCDVFFSLKKEKLFNSDNCIVVSLQCGWCVHWIHYFDAIQNGFPYIDFGECVCARNNGRLENLKTNSSNIAYCYRKWWRQWWRWWRRWQRQEPKRDWEN